MAIAVAAMEIVGLDLANLKAVFDLLRNAIGLVRDTKDILPKEKQEVVAASLVQAERAAQMAEAQIAQALGYKLCACTFPPQIMTKQQGTLNRFGGYMARCPKCGESYHVGERPPSPPRPYRTDGIV
jgi:hypothetical protein